MLSYEIKKINGKPDWNEIPTLEMTSAYLDTPKSTSAFAQLAYDGGAIYVHLRTKEDETRCVETDILGKPYEDSCLEFFFSAEEGDRRYFNIEMNSNKCLFLGFGTGVGNSARLVIDTESTFKPEVSRTEDGWEIFYRIPYSFVRIFYPDFAPRAGKRIRANCYKCAEKMTPGHFLSWSPIVGEPFTFHKPECFGLMIFGE